MKKQQVSYYQKTDIYYQKWISIPKAFAEKMEIAQATLVKILKSGQIPSIYPFFYNLEKETQYTMSEVLSTDIAIEDEKDFSADVSRRTGG